MNILEIQSFFNNITSKNILIVGDVMIDAYVWGKVERISPEAPVPILNSENKENRMGGAANVALNIQSMGAKPILCAVVGEDKKGETFLNLMKKKGLFTQGIIKSKKRITTTKTRIISHSQQLLRLDREQDNPLTEEDEKTLSTRILQIIETEDIHAIIFEDYDKGVLTQNIIEKTIHIANKKSIPTFVDPKKRNFYFYKNVSFFKPNFKELKEGTKEEISKNDFPAIFNASAKLNNTLNAGAIVTTLSDLGVFIYEKNGYKVIPAEIRQIADVSGAGDTVISIAALGVSSGLSIENSVKIANLAGGLVCEQVGVVPINKELLYTETIDYFQNL